MCSSIQFGVCSTLNQWYVRKIHNSVVIWYFNVVWINSSTTVRLINLFSFVQLFAVWSDVICKLLIMWWRFWMAKCLILFISYYFLLFLIMFCYFLLFCFILFYFLLFFFFPIFYYFPRLLLIYIAHVATYIYYIFYCFLTFHKFLFKVQK